ncbi:MAG: dockerin type I domain-containing protein [Patescibacteria group bacterium]
MFSFASLAFLLGAALITSTEASYIKLSASKTVLVAGERFSIDVYAYAHVPVNAVDITLKFEETAVDVISVDKGQSVLTIWTQEPIVKNGEVILRGGTYRKGFLGEHKIATIELEAKQSGESEMIADNVVLLAGDGKGTPVSVAESNDSSLSVYIYDENEDPENIAVNVTINILTDIDGDGYVGIRDISAFMGAWSSNTTSKIYDFNGDGKMSFRDFSIILADAFFGPN